MKVLTMKLLSLTVVVFFMFAGLALAQDNSQVFGRATDSSGGVLPGVTVTLSSPVLLESRVAITSETGTYQFPRLPIGTYSVKFELPGFTSAVREGLELGAGFNAQVNGELGVGGVAEDVVVTGVAPVVDLRSTTQGESFSGAELESIPSARDVFHVLNQTPGIAMDRQNVGGNINGQTTGMFSRGAAGNQSRFFVDGVDRSGHSGAPHALSFAAVEEVQILTGGADVEIQTPGVVVNVINKSGSDAYRGATWFYLNNRALGSDNVSDTIRQQGGLGTILVKARDYGGDFGGPIKKARAWFWGSYGLQRALLTVPNYYKTTTECAPVGANPLGYSYSETIDCTNLNTSDVPSLASKFTMRPRQGNLLTVSNQFSQRVENIRGVSALVPFEASTRFNFVRRKDTDRKLGFAGWIGDIWDPSWKFADQQALTDRWLFETSFGHYCFCNLTRPQDVAVGLQPMSETSTGHQGRSVATNYAQVVPSNDLSLTSTYFLPGRLGGDHSFKGGYRYTRKNEGRFPLELTNVTAVFNSPAPLPPFSRAFSARLTRPSSDERFVFQNSLYFQDTYTNERLTLNVGFRWDRQDDMVPAENLAAHPFQGQITLDGTPFALLPAVDAPKVTSGVIWNSVAPRLGVTYDLTGNARNVLKGSYAVYFNQRNSSATLAAALNPTSNASMDLAWTDLNGDTVVQAREIDPRVIRSVTGIDPANPGAQVTSNQVDPNITAPRTDEIVVGYGTELTGGFGLTVSYIWRKYGNFIWDDRIGLTSADYSPVTFTPPASSCPAGARCEAVTYFVPTFTLPSAFITTNRPDNRRIYNGVELVVRKRFSGGWLLNGSYSYNSTLEYYDSPAAYEDPTNISLLHGNQFAPTTGIGGGGGNALSSVPVNAKWITRVNASYLVKRIGLNVAVAADIRQGYPFIQGINIASRPNRAPGIAVLLDPPGDVRYPMYKIVDFHLDKKFSVWKTTLASTFDLFNAFNADTIMAQRTNQNAANANQVYGLPGGRTGRLGLMVTF